MLDDLEGELTKMLDLLEYSVTQEDINRAVEKNKPIGSAYKNIGKFHKKDIDYVSKTLQPYLKKYGYAFPR